MSHHGFPQEAVHSLCNICSVDSIVVGVVAVVVLLDHDQEPPEFDHVQLEELYQAILVQQVEGQGDQTVSWRRNDRGEKSAFTRLVPLALFLLSFLLHFILFPKHHAARLLVSCYSVNIDITVWQEPKIARTHSHWLRLLSLQTNVLECVNMKFRKFLLYCCTEK